MTTEPTYRRGLGLTLLLGAIVVYDLINSWSAVLAATIGAGGPAIPSVPRWVIVASVACGFVRAAGAVVLLGGRRWGFFLVCVGAVVDVALAFAFGGGFAAVYLAFMAVFVIAVLFGLLIRGGESSAWARMR